MNLADRDAPVPRRSRAFGLELESSIDIPGLAPAVADDDHASPTRIELVSPQAVEDAWPTDGAVRLLSEPPGAPVPEHTIDEHGTSGYRLFSSGFGLALVSADGTLVRCAAAGGLTWHWQRFLVGRVLPWASLLRGLEIFHASAVEINGRAIALVGPSGVGKTSLAIQLVLAGAGFVTDDVLAVDAGAGDALRAHPGASITGIRAPEQANLSDADRRRLGSMVTHDDKAYVALPCVSSPLPLGAVYFITRHDDPDGEPIEALPAPDLSVLLASTFVVSMRTPRRLHNLLDICADMATSVPAFRVRVQPGLGAAALAQRLGAHVRSIDRAAALQHRPDPEPGAASG